MVLYLAEGSKAGSADTLRGLGQTLGVRPHEGSGHQ